MFSDNIYNDCETDEQLAEVEQAVQVLSVPTALTRSAPRPATIRPPDESSSYEYTADGDGISEGIRIIRHIYDSDGIILLSVGGLSNLDVIQELSRGQCAVLTEKGFNRYNTPEISDALKTLSCSVKPTDLPGDVLANLVIPEAECPVIVEPLRQIGTQKENPDLEKYEVSPWLGYKFMVGMLPGKAGVYEPEIAVFGGMNWPIDWDPTSTAFIIPPLAVQDGKKAARFYSGWCYLYSLSEIFGKSSEEMTPEFRWDSPDPPRKRKVVDLQKMLMLKRI